MGLLSTYLFAPAIIGNMTAKKAWPIFFIDTIRLTVGQDVIFYKALWVIS